MLDDPIAPGDEVEPSGDPGTTSDDSPSPPDEIGSVAAEEPTEAEKGQKLRDVVFRRMSQTDSKLDQVLGAVATLTSQNQREDRQPQTEAPNLEELSVLAKREPLKAMAQLLEHNNQQWEQRLQQSQDQAFERQRQERGIEEVKGRLRNKHPELANEQSAFFQAADQCYRERAQLLGREPTETEKAFMIDASAQEVNARLALDRKAQVAASKDRARAHAQTQTTVPVGTNAPVGDPGSEDLSTEEQALMAKYGIKSADVFNAAKTGDHLQVREALRKK